MHEKVNEPDLAPSPATAPAPAPTPVPAPALATAPSPSPAPASSSENAPAPGHVFAPKFPFFSFQNLTLGQHDNYDCACVPHDMKVLLEQTSSY